MEDNNYLERFRDRKPAGLKKCLEEWFPVVWVDTLLEDKKRQEKRLRDEKDLPPDAPDK